MGMDIGGIAGGIGKALESFKGGDIMGGIKSIMEMIKGGAGGGEKGGGAAGGPGDQSGAMAGNAGVNSFAPEELMKKAKAMSALLGR